jgi:teichuronic acid biosynthesis glycosyltransferase TuaC
VKILTYTSLFPNNVTPNLGAFVARRMACWAEKYASSWRIVAPVPFFPKLPVQTPWQKYSDIFNREPFQNHMVHHPVYLMLPKIGLPIQGLSMALCTSAAAKHIISEHGPFDLLDAHFVYPDGYAALQISRKFDLPLVVTARGSDINSYSQIEGIRSKIQQVLKNVDAIVGVSNDLVEKMIALGAPEKRCHLITNGVDLERFRPRSNSEPKKVAPKLLAVGNLVPEKGVQLLLNAVFALLKEHPEIKLDIVGTGPEHKALSDTCISLGIEGHVHFFGQIPHDKIHALFQNAGVFCITSLREGNPNVVMEALATGVPVAATPVGGVPELIVDAVNGFLAKAHTPESVANAIHRVLEKEWSPHKIRETVAGRTWEHVADEVQYVFEGVLQRRKKNRK